MTSRHLLCSDHEVVSPLDREQRCSPTQKLEQGCPCGLPNQRHAAQCRSHRNSVRSLRRQRPALEKPSGSCRQRDASRSQPIRLRVTRRGLNFRDRLRAPRRDCWRNFRCPVRLRVPPAIERSPRLHGLVESALFPAYYVLRRSQALSPGTCGSEPAPPPTDPFEAEPLRGYREPVRFQGVVLWLRVTSKWLRRVVLCREK